MKNSAQATRPAGREILLVFYFGVFVPVGGVERFAINLLNGLSDLGLKAKLVCSARREWLPQDMRFEWLRAPYVPGSLYHVSDWLLLFFRGWYEVRRASSVVFGKMPPALILRILRICRGPKTRFIFVTPYAPIAATPEEDNRLRRSLELFDVVVVQAEAFRQTLLDVGVQTPIKVLPYPLDENIKRLQVTELPPGPPWRIGFLGRLEPQKMVDTLFEALSEMGRTDLELHLYGSGSQQQRLQNLAETHPMAGRIFFHGAIPYAVVPKAVMENHLFAFSSCEEGQVLAALEILACGRPIAATPAGALAEILADRRLGFCAETCGSAPLAAALADVLAKLKTRSLTPETIREAFDQRWNRPGLLAEYAQLLEAS